MAARSTPKKKMNDSEQEPHLTLSPSFGDESRQVPAADGGEEADGGDDFDFEFSVASPFSAYASAAGGGDPADEIFADGRILPVYPVFNRRILESGPDPKSLRSGSASSTSSAESLDIGAPLLREGATEGTYCAWAPRSAPQSPDRAACKKSSSAGSGPGTSKRWSVMDLVGGRRSHSDGKEKLVNFGSSSGAGARPKPNPRPNPTPKGVVKGEMDLLTAHRLFYGKDKAAEKGSGKRSFLPYRPELVGLFANSRAHHHHPFNF